jgi:hypothetical protein
MHFQTLAGSWMGVATDMAASEKVIGTGKG